MSFPVTIDPSLPPAERYAAIQAQADALLADEHDPVANAANLSALIFQTVPDLNWVGFYFFDGRELVVGPFQGMPACVRIPLGRGVCGTAAATRTTQVVPDVHAFPGHIACDGASRSELVVPLVRENVLVGVLDIDSPVPDRFQPVDRDAFETLARRWLAASTGRRSAPEGCGP